VTFVYRLARLAGRWRDRRGPRREQPIAEQRAEMDRFWGRARMVRGSQVDRTDAGGVAAEWVSAPGTSTGKAVVYLHGGSYASGSPRSHRGLASRLSAASGASVLVPEYRLTPEHPFPAAVEDAVVAYGWLLEEGFLPGSLAVAGDSAGGGLAVSLLLALQDRGSALPSGVVALAPWVDLGVARRRQTVPPDVSLTDEGLCQAAASYLAGADPAHPLASPVRGDLSGLPPLFVQVGTADLLVEDARRLAEAARRAGVSVELDEWRGMPHSFQMYAPVSRNARRAVRRAGDFLRERLR
jgi:acetyl esterase/lipase